jgi:hypothetical protein
MLLEHIKRYDKEKSIKIVSVDELRSKNIKIDSKVHSVPALLLMPSKELLFGKAVFDHLLLPPRGILCSGQSTRNDKSTKKENALDVPDSYINKPTLDITSDGEPAAFSLTGFTLSDTFSNIDDTVETIVDKNYNWDIISDDKNIKTYQGSFTASDVSTPESGKSIINNKTDKTNGLPSIEELMQQRDKEIMAK